MHLDLLVAVIAAGRDVQQIDAEGRQEFSKGDGVGDGPAVVRFAVVHPFGGGDAVEQGHGVRDDGADGLDDFEREADAVGESAAVRVGTRVAEWREEGAEEVAVRAVDFDHVDARGDAAACGVREARDHGADVGMGHFPGGCVAFAPLDGAGAEDVVWPAVGGSVSDDACAALRDEPWGYGRGFAACVCELDA